MWLENGLDLCKGFFKSELKELFVCVIPGKIGWSDLAKI